MKASVYYGKGDIRIESVPGPEIEGPTDALLRITHACVCGSDLWFYRGYEPDWKPGFRTGHEASITAIVSSNRTPAGTEKA
jgi:Threonine dehydrogenase and related Zn-dependent dehydrogenases